MGKRPGSTLRAQWLGQQLRELREAAGMTLQEAGDYLQRDPSMVSRFESAASPIRRGDVTVLLDLYVVSDKRRRDALLRLSEDVWHKGWWDGYAGVLDYRFVDYAWLESRASMIRTYEAMLVPGLLQTRDYAEVLATGANGATSAEQLAAGIDFRMRRQQVLDRDEPLHVEAVLDEAVIRRVIGGPEVMRAQLAHLLEQAERSHIDIRVLPLDAGYHPGLGGPFTVFEMPEPYSEVAYVDTPAGAVYVETPEASSMARKYDGLCSNTLGAKDSAGFISAATKELQ